MGKRALGALAQKNDQNEVGRRGSDNQKERSNKLKKRLGVFKILTLFETFKITTQIKMVKSAF